MNTRKLIVAMAVSGCLMQAYFSTQAQACSVPNLKGEPVAGWATHALPSAEIAAMAAGAAPAAVAATGGANSTIYPGPGFTPPIVGMWQFAFTAQGNGASGPPDGTPIDAGFQTWHIDRTELMNSGRPAATGNFCMGVWAQVNWGTYSLNHWALAWDFDKTTGAPTVFVGPANIQEKVTVDVSGNVFSGNFSLTQYAPDGATVLGGVKGVVNGTRVTVN